MELCSVSGLATDICHGDVECAFVILVKTARQMATIRVDTDAVCNSGDGGHVFMNLLAGISFVTILGVFIKHQVFWPNVTLNTMSSYFQALLHNTIANIVFLLQN